MAPLPNGSVFKGKKLLTQYGSEIDAETALADKKVIACYFSAHWCPPCRQFTPMLKDFFEQLADFPLAIIFVSSDRDEQSMREYFQSQGDYFAVPFGAELSQALQAACDVSGIPMLAVINRKGEMLHDKGRSDIASLKPEDVYKKWAGLSL